MRESRETMRDTSLRKGDVRDTENAGIIVFCVSICGTDGLVDSASSRRWRREERQVSCADISCAFSEERVLLQIWIRVHHRGVEHVFLKDGPRVMQRTS